MTKASINRILVTEQNFNQTLLNVIEVVLQNYDSAPVTVTYKDQSTILPPAQNIGGVMVPSYEYKFNCLGHPFDVQLSIEATRSTTNVMLNYSTIVPKNC